MTASRRCCRQRWERFFRCSSCRFAWRVPALAFSSPRWSGGTALYALWAMVMPSTSGLLWRAANLRTPDLSVNAVVCVLPVFSLAWLWLAGLVRVESPGLLAAGFLLVLGANLVLALRPVRLGRVGFPSWGSAR